MSDLVERLRDAANKSVMDFGEHWNLEDEAADEIERNREAIAELVEVLKMYQRAGAGNSTDFAWQQAANIAATTAIAKYDTTTKETK